MGGAEPGSAGARAERLVEDRVRAALPPGASLHANVRFVAKAEPRKPAHDGEADLVVVHPEHGVLVIETKSGTPSRSGDTWFLGSRRLDRSPFRQAESNKHDLVRTLADILSIEQRELRAGHAVAFPDADLASLPRGHALLGPDVHRDLVLDAAALESDAATAAALDAAWRFWTGDGTKGAPLTPHQLERINEFLAPTAVLTRLVKRDVDDGNHRLVQASTLQKLVLNQHRAMRRLEVVGPAGSGKSLIAVEKARRLAREGWRTLFVCFNQPLASAVQREMADTGEPPERLPTVTTFHRLCETLGARAGTLPPKPAGELPPEWWSATLPNALDDAITALADERYHALVIDEGQDFELDWLLSLEFLLRDPAEDILWVFHDPGQALYRDDRVAELGLEHIDLYEDYRCPAPVTRLAARFYQGRAENTPYAVMEEGTAPVVVEAEPGTPTVEAVRQQLHALLVEQGVKAWDVAVLAGTSAVNSEVWRRRRFGNYELWNGAIDDAGRSLGLPAEEVPDVPPDDHVVLFETVRRFKGLERPVVILCELPEEATRLDALLYTGLTRATAHLVVIAPPNLSQRLRSMGDA